MLGRRTPTDPADRTLRKDRVGASPVKVGVIVLAVILVLTYFGFTKDIPFTHGYRLKAVVESANSIRPNSPVRIAGVNVGKVKTIERAPGTDMSIVVLELQDKALPIHKDATVKIRPRIFLEGNYFVDLQPGTPAAPRLNSGDTIPVSQTAGPVQLDQVLTSLQADTRRSLQLALTGFGNGLTRKPTAADDAAADPDARGKTAAQSLNQAFGYAPKSLKNTAIISDALTGTETHDLTRLLDGISRTTEGLGRNERSLQDLITNFNTTLAATASEATNLRASLRLLPPTLEASDAAFDSLNAAFPNTRGFARDILPGVRETPATIAASYPWIAQARPLVSQAELGGLVASLSPATRDLSKVVDASTSLLPQVDLASKCIDRVVLPTGDVVIRDGNLTSGAANYKEFWYSLVGLSGEGQNSDGNGQYVRFQTGGGTQTVSLTGGASTLFGNAASPPLGTRPAYTGKLPPYQPGKACYRQTLPDLNGAAYGPSDPAVQTSPATTLPAPATAAASGALAMRAPRLGAPVGKGAGG